MAFPPYMTPKDIAWSITAVFQAVVGGVAGGAYIKEDPFRPGTGRMDLDGALEDAARLAERISQKGEDLCTMHHLIRPGADLEEAIRHAEAREMRRLRSIQAQAAKEGKGNP